MGAPKVEISDHALLRYLERVGGFDIMGLRRSIAACISGGAISTPQTMVIDGFRFVVRAGSRGPVLMTVVEPDPDLPMLLNPGGRQCPPGPLILSPR